MPSSPPFFGWMMAAALLWLGNPPAILLAAKSHSSPRDPAVSSFSTILIFLVLIWLGAKIGGELFERFRQPAVMGELLAGVLLGNLPLVGIHALEGLAGNTFIFFLAEIGVVLLLFEVGLASNLHEMLEVGWSSLLVALIGVLTPFLLGWGVGLIFLPNSPPYVHIFLGATLTATSVGITARVLQDLGKTGARESRVILGAAVVDDVLGLLILAVITGIIQTANTGDGVVPAGTIFLIAGKAASFLVLATWVGSHFSPRVFGWASRLRVRGMLLVTSLSFCFFLSYLAALVKLAPLVGAFAAGLILEPVHYADFKQREERSIEDLISPLSTLLVPVFFVYMGLQVNLQTLADPAVLLLSGVLSLAAMVGKLACGAGAVEKGLDRLSIGIGMVPRGEVGLIFAGIGMTLLFRGAPLITPSVYSALVIMVILTTLVTPVALKCSLAKGDLRKLTKQPDSAFLRQDR